jgi:peptidoglycan hydrolase CwlO-like protein
MVSDELAKQLHHKASQNEALSPQEQSLLEEWYAFQDGIESETLGLSQVEPDLAALRAQVETLLAQLTTVTKRIQTIAAENKKLKREIAILHRQLQATMQPAG